MNRAELQRLAEDRILDAQALLAGGRWSGAYYLAGYAVECGLKACILARIERTGVIFEDRRFSEKCWTHSVEDLVKVANLEAIRVADMAANAALQQNWDIAKEWTEASRYQQKTQVQAQRLFDAVTDNISGVLQWIRSHW